MAHWTLFHYISERYYIFNLQHIAKKLYPAETQAFPANTKNHSPFTWFCVTVKNRVHATFARDFPFECVCNGPRHNYTTFAPYENARARPTSRERVCRPLACKFHSSRSLAPAPSLYIIIQTSTVFNDSLEFGNCVI